MPKVTIPNSNGWYISESLPISAQECVNWYPNFPQAPSLTEGNLFGTPGTVQIATSGAFSTDINRGSHVKSDVAYYVNGATLYRLNRDDEDAFSLIALGTIEGTGRVSMSDNGTQLCIMVPGGAGYIYNEDAGTPFEEIADVDFRANGNPQYVDYIDGYFVFTTDEKKFIISALNDGLSYNALDFGSAEADPDKVVAPLVHDSTLFIFGSETFESFQNIGGSGFPFQRIQGSVISIGLFGAFSVSETSNAFYFIGGSVNESPAIWVSNGGEPQKVSTTAIDQLLDTFSETAIRDSFTWTYAQKGAAFVGFTINGTTLVYDTVSKRWHERKSVIAGALDSWRVNSLVKAYGRVLVGDSKDGRIGALDRDLYTEYDLPIFRRFAIQPITTMGDSFSLPEIELTVESGVGNDAVPNPVIRMEWSKDGKTFQDDRTRGLGKRGEFNRRAIWRRNGRYPRFAVLRWTLTDAVKPNIISLVADIA
jgi:hypothetical protein